MALLEIDRLQVQFRSPRGILRAVDGVSFSVDRGEIVAVVGESGCGKSVTSMSILGLVGGDHRIGGEIRLEDRDVLKLPQHQMRRLRGGVIGMIFQDPMSALNPVFTIGRQICEGYRLHTGASAEEARQKAIEMLTLVGIPSPEQRIDEYPHRLSGGMRQRVMIAIALACNPKLLIADEPTTALDVTIQAQILDLLRDLNRKTGTAIMLITHDLGVVAETASRVVVMYAGRKVEEAPVDVLFRRPAHPYTRGLLAAAPVLGSTIESEDTRMIEIPGQVPALTKPIKGCAFANRCQMATDFCREVAPILTPLGDGQVSACHLGGKQTW